MNKLELGPEDHKKADLITTAKANLEALARGRQQILQTLQEHIDRHQAEVNAARVIIQEASPPPSPPASGVPPLVLTGQINQSSPSVRGVLQHWRIGVGAVMLGVIIAGRFWH